MDSSLFDFVAYNVLEEFVDLLEMTTWTARRVKENIDEVLDNSFILLAKQQDMMQPAIKLAEDRNRKECTDGVVLNVSDVVFNEYFNINMNCPLVGQKMAVFFNEIHNITSKIADIHRRYINGAINCGPPVYQNPSRQCLQDLIKSCRDETGVLRNFLLNLNYEVDEFMDGHVEEAYVCCLKSMSLVRGAAKKAINDIHYCLHNKEFNIDKKYDSPMVRQSMGMVERPFDRIAKILENDTEPPVSEPNPLHYKMPEQPYYQPSPPPQPQMHPDHPQMQHPPQYVHPQHFQGRQINPQAQQFHPQMQVPHPQMQQPQAQPRPFRRTASKDAPPWKIDVRKHPGYKGGNVGDDSFEFDPSFLENFRGTEEEEHGGEDNHKFDDEL